MTRKDFDALARAMDLYDPKALAHLLMRLGAQLEPMARVIGEGLCRRVESTPTVIMQALDELMTKQKCHTDESGKIDPTAKEARILICYRLFDELSGTWDGGGKEPVW